MNNADDELKKFKKQLEFSLQEEKIIKNLGIKSEAFLPLLFSIKYGGDWSFKTDSVKVLAVKDKLTRYDEEKMAGYTLENILLFLNPILLKEEGTVYRLEKCGNKKEREIVKRPYKIQLDGEDIIKAVLNPMTLEVAIKRINGPLLFEGPLAYGVSHEMDHLRGTEITGKSLWDFTYVLENKG